MTEQGTFTGLLSLYFKNLINVSSFHKFNLESHWRTCTGQLLCKVTQCFYWAYTWQHSFYKVYHVLALWTYVTLLVITQPWYVYGEVINIVSSFFTLGSFLTDQSDILYKPNICDTCQTFTWKVADFPYPPVWYDAPVIHFNNN